MDLPFAVDSPDRDTSNSLHQSHTSSLITASSEGSLLPVDGSEYSSGIYPDPRYDALTAFPASHQGQSRIPASVVTSSGGKNQPTSRLDADDEDMVDFTYVTAADADEVDVLVDGRDPAPDQDVPRGDVLAILLSGDTQSNNGEAIVSQCEEANGAAHRAFEAKRKGDLRTALTAHTKAAKTFREAAITVREKDGSLFESLLLLSQTQARSALALKRFLKQYPEGIPQKNENSGGDATASALSHKERLRATVRGALSSQNEADISDSMFLGRASASSSSSGVPQKSKPEDNTSAPISDHSDSGVLSQNPVDEMMALERELRDMDMALEMGNSIMSLGARTQSRMKPSTMEDGSFCVVPPSQSPSAASSSLWASGIGSNPRPTSGSGTSGQRARANRVQNILDASSVAPVGRANVSPPTSHISPTAQQRNAAAPSGLESSWWGNQSAASASQMLASSFVNMGSSRIVLPAADSQPADTKQLMRLLDSLRLVSEENATLLREVESAEAARNEAKTAREEMRRFQKSYGKRFEALKSALEQFRKDYPQREEGQSNPVATSNFVQTASVADQIQRQEQLIRKLTADLKKEKEESRKKDAALRKYESFYREVKARSAQKAAQRQKEAQQRQRSKIPASRPPR